MDGKGLLVPGPRFIGETGKLKRYLLVSALSPVTPPGWKQKGSRLARLSGNDVRIELLTLTVAASGDGWRDI
jgi:hypothetical protein